jgi:hypothetical protein
MMINRSESSKAGAIVIDCAGAVEGGAARFLRELKLYLSTTRAANIRLIGEGQKLTSKWLIKRETIAASAKRRIALNNAGFVNPKGRNITLLRNILQFATSRDINELRFTPSLRLRAQTPVVRTLARASSALVVPCSRMAEQVQTVSPHLADRLVVRFHPVSQPYWAGEPPANPRNVLLPIVPAPYKNLDSHLADFLRASRNIPGAPINILIPSSPSIFPQFEAHPRVQFIGPQPSVRLEEWWRSSGAVFFPTTFEAFGYALAEGRVYGRRVIGQNTQQNQEIAGQALSPYELDDEQSLRNAIGEAVNSVAESEPEPFDPNEYFSWLFNLDEPTRITGTYSS